MKKIFSTIMVPILLMLGGCQSMYFNAMEKVGYHKRDIMVERVEASRDAQQEAKQQFASALENMQVLLHHKGEDLQTAYENAKDEYESSLSAAADVTNRINKVEDVAEALFEEWHTEIGEISKASLRRASQNKLKQTSHNYEQMLRTMRRSEAKMKPVLIAMKDNMLYLKHNLNAQAIGAIKGEFISLQTDISGLIKEMNQSIEASNRFISSINHHLE